MREVHSIPVGDFDIMIVGGGPAGVSTWLHLHKFAPDLAERTVLIEKEKYPRDKLCGGGVGAWSQNILKYLDVKLEIPSVYISDVEFKFKDEIFNLHQKNQFQMVQRIEFDHALAKTAVGRGLKLHENEAFADFTRSNDDLIVTTSRGNNYKVRVLVGADGSLSRVRKKMNLLNKSNLAPTLEVFAPVNPEIDKEFEERKIVIDMTPQEKGLQGYIWHVPCIKNGIPSVGHGIVDLRLYPKKPRVDMRYIFHQELLSRNLSITKKSWSSHPIHYFLNEDYISQPNIILVGDAAGIEPAFGGGIHFALSYGKISALEIIKAFETNDFSFKNYKKNFQSHFSGKFISKCIHIAYKLYDKKMNPFEAAREVFTIKN